MRAALNEITSQAVVRVQMAADDCHYVYMQATKIWPDGSGRVAQIVLDNPLFGSNVKGEEYNLACMHMRLMDYTLGIHGCSASNYMSLEVGGNTYHITKTYNGTPVVTHKTSYENSFPYYRTIITFANGTGPFATSIKVGDKVKIKFVCKGWDEEWFTSTQGTDIRTFGFPATNRLKISFQYVLGTTKYSPYWKLDQFRMYKHPESLVERDTVWEVYARISGAGANTSKGVTYTLNYTLGEKPQGNSDAKMLAFYWWKEATRILDGESLVVTISKPDSDIKSAKVRLGVEPHTITCENAQILSYTTE